MGAVRAPHSARDPADEREPGQSPPRMTDLASHVRPAAVAETLVTRHGAHGGARVTRALAAYSEVAGGGQRGSLQDLLGFDAYA